MSLNQVVVVGNLTEDPRKGNTASVTVANMRMASDFRVTDPEGNKIERTEYVDVEAYGVMGENCLASLRKGSRVIVAGYLRYDEWQDSEGNKRSKLKVKASVVGDSLEFAKK